MILRRSILFLALSIAALLPVTLRAEGLQLIMVEQVGCHWCARWNEEIAPIYPQTEAGEAAPLRRIDLRDPSPEDLTFYRPPVFTPTFILVENGVEFARLEGYPGEDFFWGLIEQMLTDHGALDLDASG